MMNRLKDDLVPLVLRWALGIIAFSHGYFKFVVGDGHRWAPNLEPDLATLVAVLELVGGIALALGVLTRLFALGIGAIQVGAVALVTWERDFIHDLIAPGPEPGFRFTSVGYEYNFALLAIAFSLIILGGGAISVDRLVRRTLQSRRGSNAVDSSSAVQPAGKR